MSIFSRVPTKPTGSMRKRYTPVNNSSFNFGGIYPILCKNVMPGDTWKMNLSSFVRTVPLIAPVMHRNDIKVDAFFVPYRLIWKSAEEWFACNEAVKRPKMYFDGSNFAAFYNLFLGPGSLYDYFNFGTPSQSDIEELGLEVGQRKVDMMPIRAYRMIYDYYFRNKAVEDDITSLFPNFYGDDDFVVTYQQTADGRLIHPENYYSYFLVQMRPWRRDIFTSALPDPQNGPDVVIPQSELEIESDGHLNLSAQSDSYYNEGDLEDNSGTVNRLQQDGGTITKVLEYNKGLKVDSNSIPTMRTLRAANLMEEFEEAMARIGYSESTFNTGKFKEWLRGIWNVKSSDSRLDIPEWLGGYRGPITISEIPQTSGSTDDSPQGNLAGKGVSAGGSRLFKKKFFEEPGIMMVLMSIVPKSAYCQGDPREWLYESGFEYPNPYFEGLGEQEVMSKELNCLADLFPNVQKTFGYNVRNYEMKSYPDEIHGAFRTNLAYWHEGRIFRWNNFPGLNKDFLKVKPSDVSRIFPSTEESDKLLGQFFFDITIKRRLNPYGLPKFSNF